MRKTNKIFLYILQSICYTLGSVLIFVLLANGLFNIKPNFSIIIPLTLLFFCVVLIISEILEKSRNIDLLESKIFIVASILSSLMAGVLSGYEQGFLTCAVTVVYFGVVLLVAISTNRNVSIKSVESLIYIRFIKTFAITILISSFYIFEEGVLAFGNRVIDFIAIYFIASILYVICFNYNEQYETAGSVNKDKNIFILNSIVVFLAGISIFFRKHIILLVEIFNNYINPWIDEAINKIMDKITILVEKALKTNIGNFIVENMDGTNNPIEEEISKVEEGTYEIVEEIVEKADTDIIYNIIFAILIIYLVYILYKKLRKYMYKKQNKGNFEEREFIFKKEDLFSSIKNSFANMFKKRENLSKERLMYKKTVNELIKDGYEISKIITPNEYISTIVEGDIKKYNFNKITSDYNADRYGKNV